MKKSTVKSAALMVLASGFLFGGLGCLNLGGIVRAGIRGLPGGVLSQLLTDSNAVFDLFGETNTANAPL